MVKPFAQRLLAWFDRHGRKDLPWQQDITPYRVWLSEVMLQQTQVATVVPYFQRFISAFPDVTALAAAPLDEVLHLWTGLGYYARGRNLHKTAGIIAADCDGVFPDTVESLQQLPGIGRSTAGAISAIAFGARAPILDGNVKRVLARHGAIEGYPGTSDVAKTLWQLADNYTPHLRCGDYTQAIMDLGATLCTRSAPDCKRCPLNADCRACQLGDPHRFPGKKPSKKIPIKTTLFLILENAANEVLLQQRPAQGLWGGLWTFPECAAEANINDTCVQLGYRAIHWQAAPKQRHTFSHFHLDFTPVRVSVADNGGIAERPAARWVMPCAPGNLGLPQPIKALLEQLSPAD